MVTRNKKEKQAEIVIKLPNYNWLLVGVRSTAPLVVHAWSEKAKRELDNRGTPEAKKEFEQRDPEEEARAALYCIAGEENSYGIPAAGFKKGIVQVAKDIPGKEINGKFIMRQVFVVADVGDLVRIETKSGWKIREDIVRLSSGAPQIRWRPQFDDWSAQLRLRFNADILSAQSVLNLLIRAGAEIGWGEMRPEKGGTYGTYEIYGEVRIERASSGPLIISKENGR